MKHIKTIILILILIVAIIGISLIFINKNYQTNQENDLTVKMIYNTGEFDIETYKNITKEINLTKKQQSKIINFYKNTDLSELPPEEQVDLLFMETITLEFSDGNTIAVDHDDDTFAFLNHKDIISVSKEFSLYVFNIINH